MNRRGFLGLLAGGAVVAVVAAQPELWLPTKTIFLPPRGGWHGNSALTIDLIMREALRVLHQNCTFISQINRQYDPTFAVGSQWPRNVIQINQRQLPFTFNTIEVSLASCDA